MRSSRESCQPFRRSIATGIGWWIAVGAMLDWHPGLIETEEGSPRRLGAADALTLARAWLVPAIADDLSSAALLVCAVTDVADGMVARAGHPTRAGRDLEGLVDAAVAVSALSAAARKRLLSRTVVLLEGAHITAGFAYALARYFARLEAPRPTVVRAARLTTPLRMAGLVAAGARHRGWADTLVATGSAASIAVLIVTHCAPSTVGCRPVRSGVRSALCERNASIGSVDEWVVEREWWSEHGSRRNPGRLREVAVRERFYDEDLAAIHASGFLDIARAAAEEALGRLPAQSRVLDLGCGDGTTAAMLAAGGHDVAGLDRSPAMIALAQAKHPGVRFAVGDDDADLPTDLDAVLAIGEVLSYVTDRRGALRDRLARLVSCLRPGGLLMFDVAAPDRAADGDQRTWTCGNGWAVLTATSGSDRRLCREIVTFRRQATGDYRRTDERHELELYPVAEVIDALAAAGADEVSAHHAYASLRLPAGLVAYTARRPPSASASLSGAAS